MQEFSRAVEEQATQRNTTPQLQLFATSLAAVFQILGELSGLLFFLFSSLNLLLSVFLTNLFQAYAMPLSLDHTSLRPHTPKFLNA
jgi:hypothetical protein